MTKGLKRATLDLVELADSNFSKGYYMALARVVPVCGPQPSIFWSGGGIDPTKAEPSDLATLWDIGYFSSPYVTSTIASRPEYAIELRRVQEIVTKYKQSLTYV